MSKIAVIGSGFIGRAWAIAFARAGHSVALWDQDPAAPGKAIDYIRGVLPDLAKNELLGGAAPEEALARIFVARALDDALDGASHVQESTPERLDVKKAIFALLDEHAEPDTIIASSTSAILPSLFTETLRGRHRCLVVHPINPPYLIPAVEIVPAPWTSTAVLERTRDLLVATGQAPIVMRRELDGFVMNRMQAALLEEAFRLVADGYVTVEDVDVGIREGLALRWSFIGPFETIDLNAPGGVRDYVHRYEDLYRGLFQQMRRRVEWGGEVLHTIERDLRDRVAQADLPDRQAWRDRRLMALVAHKRRAAREIGD